MLSAMHVARNDLPTGEFFLGISGCSLIALVGFLTILYPQTTYEWLVFKIGRDNMRRGSPERGRFQLWAHRGFGALMLLGGAFFSAILILGKLASL
jgi:hypothetical protein